MAVNLSRKVTQEDIDILSADFVDVERRAKKRAMKILAWTTLVASFFAALFTYGTNFVQNRFLRIEEIDTKLVQLQDANARLEGDLQSTKADLEKEVGLERRLDELEQQLSAKRSSK